MPVRGLRAFALALPMMAVLTSAAFAQSGGAAEGDGADGRDRVVRLTSLDWPPYSGDGLKDGGAAVVVARAAFAAVGYRLEVSFYPWNRAVILARDGAGAEGYFPAYAASSRERDFILSAPLGSSPLGFAERVSAPVTWTSLDELGSARIGVVDGYANTEAFDERIADGRLRADRSSTDLTNLKKLAAGRTDLAVIDRAVMKELLRTSSDLKAVAGSLRFHPRILENKTLHVAFRKGERGRDLARLFAEGLARIDAAALLNLALSQTGS